MNLAPYIDHTFLKPNGTAADIEKLCAEAREHSFAAVCVNPCFVKFAHSLLDGSSVKTCTVIGFPLGQNTTHLKLAEAMEAISNGADELDFVINISLLKGDPDECEHELRVLALASRNAATQSGREITTKLIIECCYLTEDEKRRACELAKAAGFDFVKTSTGFGSGGATAEDVKLMRSVVGGEMGVKAAGGVRTREDALKMIDAGASRIGTSNGVAIVAG